jgi:precorrin-2 methylase
MTKKNNIMSLSLDPDIQEKLRFHAKQKTNGNVSKLIREIAEKYLVIDDDVIPVILKVPIQLKGDKENLQKWFELKTQAIVKALSN